MTKSRFFFSVFLAGSVLIALPSLVSAQSWSDPTALPPSNNVGAPLNISTSDQTKLGSLLIGNGLGITGGNLVVANGSTTASQFCLAGVCINSWPSGVSGATVAWVPLPSGGTNQGGSPSWVFYPASTGISPESICTSAGYTTFTGACKDTTSTGGPYPMEGSVVGEYNNGWSIGCYGGVGQDGRMGTTQILCIKSSSNSSGPGTPSSVSCNWTGLWQWLDAVNGNDLGAVCKNGVETMFCTYPGGASKAGNTPSQFSC